MTRTRMVVFSALIVCGLLLSLGTTFATPAAATTLTTTQDTTTTSDPDAAATCLGAPATPAKSATGLTIRTSAHQDCGIFTVVWLMRYQADQSAWRTIFERYVQPGTTGYIEYNCWGTGTYTYRSIHWDPNMAFNKMSDPVVITC